ncbi:helix-turn-helix domain-containing protein [Desulfovibrio desulfuricans]|uniref:helix-turn-helix domain-containing protein n=1 Tax=Desulfovibrio desulfuricans TaxID=876 RepID=UPI001C02406F|nr:helix-turn-helix transcriptional regulator [Desulfovibrio desulfuricans]
MRGIITSILAEIPKEELVFDDLSFAVSQQIYAMLNRRGLSQKNLSEMLKCSEAAISKNLSGDANLTLKTIAKMLTVLSAEMKIAIVDAGVEGFWLEKFNRDSWKLETPHICLKECADVPVIAA